MSFTGHGWIKPEWASKINKFNSYFIGGEIGA